MKHNLDRLQEIIQPFCLFFAICIWLLLVVPLAIVQFGIRKPLDKIMDWLIDKIV